MRDVKNSRAFLAFRLVERSRKPSRILRNPKLKDLFKMGIYTLGRIAPIDRVPFHLRPCLSTARDSSPKDDRSRVRFFAVLEPCAMLEIRKKKRKS